MYVSNLVVVFILASTAVLNAACVQAQIAEDVSEHDDFRVTTSVSLGLTGPSYQTQFQLVDELGVEYDAMSLVADPIVRDAVQLSEEQSKQIHEMKKAITKELESQLASAIASEEGRKEIELRFREVEAEVRSLLDSDQLVLLEQARIQRGITRHGLPDFLATRQMRDEFGLSDSDLETLKSNHLESTTSHQSRTESMAREANLALIAELSDANQEKLKDLMDDGFNKFVESKLFVAKKSIRRDKQDHTRSLLRLLRIKKVRDKLKLTGDQYEEVQSLLKRARQFEDAELRTELNQVLTTDQTNQLNQYGVQTETARYGTVNELSYGLLSDLLGLNPEESTRIFESGKEIFDGLTQDLADSKVESFRNSLGSLSAEKREHIIAALDDSTMRR